MNLKISYSDPLLKVVYDVHENIYQFLDGNDVKKMSMVSTAWFDVIGYSKECMKKIELHIKNDDLLSISSSRRYSCMKFECGKDATDLKLYANVLAKFAHELERLQFGDMNPALDIRGITYPKLKSLKIGWLASADALDKVMSSVSSSKLEELYIDSDCSERIITFLEMHRHVKKLSLLGVSQLTLKCRDVESIKNLTLTMLRIGHLSSRMLENATLKQNILQFLDQQSASLIHLSTSTSDQQILFKAMSMPHLKSIEIYSKMLAQPDQFPVNKSIESAKITARVEDLRVLLERLPNLKKLHIEYLTSVKLQFIAEKAMKLDEIYYNDSFTGKVIEETYETIKMNAGETAINRDIQLTLISNNFELFV